MESIGADLATLVRTPLSNAHVEAMRAIGTGARFEPGHELSRIGTPVTHLHYVIDGEVEAVNPCSGERYGDASLGPTRYFGDIAFLSGGTNLYAGAEGFIGAGDRGSCDRRAGRHLQSHRELHGLPDRYQRCGPVMAWRGAGDDVRHPLRRSASRDGAEQTR